MALFVRGVAVAVVAVTGVAGAGVAPAVAAAAAVPAGAQPAPAAAIRAGFLEAVSCPAPPPAPLSGSAQETSLAERWDGTNWALQHALRPAGRWMRCSARQPPRAARSPSTTTPRPGTARHGPASACPSPRRTGSGLTGVSCTSATACTAVGSYYTPDELELLVWVGRWNGKKWTSQAAPARPRRPDSGRRSSRASRAPHPRHVWRSASIPTPPTPRCRWSRPGTARHQPSARHVVSHTVQRPVRGVVPVSDSLHRRRHLLPCWRL